jgi:RimJ/RimL family protein N-acetyltransferase
MADRINTRNLHLGWSIVPWDAAVTGFPVWQLNDIGLNGPSADTDMRLFEEARDRAGVGLISCRLGHDQLNASMFLENHGFRFIEMIYRPELELAPGRLSDLPEPSLSVVQATEEDLPQLIDMAGTAFCNERFNVDPRLGPEMGNRRYQNWIRSSFMHPSQQLYALKDDNSIVSFFVTEMQNDGVCYWHLNAVSPEQQGQGYGLRSWLTMLHQAEDAGAMRVRTSIVARNHRVLNLYARLGFRFPPPMMTFHWVKESQVC